MTDAQITPADETLRMAYKALVDFHINLVQMRFTVAGLGFAANGFLIGAFLQHNEPALLFRAAIVILGMALNIVCWLLEIRTVRVLANLGTRGKNLENLLRLSEDQGFFFIMEDEMHTPGLSGTHPWQRSARQARLFFSHNVGIGILYAIFILFWLTAAVYTLFF